MIFNSIVNAVKKIKYRCIVKKVNFQNILDKCISEKTHITGVAGTGKSSFLATITEKLYKESKPYLMCSNSVRELEAHFQKHKPGDNILFFVLDKNRTHTIDINYLFSLDVFLNFVSASAKDKEALKSIKNISWFSFLHNEDNKKYFKDGYWEHINTLIQEGHIDECGDLNKDSSQNPISAYLVLDYSCKYVISEDEKKRYIFLLNIIQLSLSKEKINIVFDEERIFFSGYQNDYIKSINIEGVNNNYIFCSQLLNKVIDNTQIVCFKSFMFENSLDTIIKDSPKELNHKLRELKQGEFLFFDKEGILVSQDSFIVPHFIGKHREIDWEIYLNNKQKKLYGKLSDELVVRNIEKEKIIKI